MPEKLSITSWTPNTKDRKAYFGPDIGWITVPIFGRNELSEQPADGPMIIEEDSSLTIVTPGWRASLDHLSNIVLEPA